MFCSRACPWRCTYCHNSYGKTFRERSAEHVLAEIELLVTRLRRQGARLHGRHLQLPAGAREDDRAGHHRRGLEARADVPERLPRRHPRRGARRAAEEGRHVPLHGRGRERPSPRMQKVMKKNLKIDKVRDIVDFIADAGRDGARRVHARLPDGDRGGDGSDDRLGRELELFHTAAFFRVIPFKGTELFKQVEHAGFDAPDRLVGVRAVPERHQPVDGARGADLRAAQEGVPALLSATRSGCMRIFKLIPSKSHMIPYLTLLFARRAYAR